jgi:hypothetical protein
MKRILHIIHGLSIGGAETFIYNLMVGMDRSQFVFDFAIQNPNIKHLHIKQLTEMGGVKFSLSQRLLKLQLHNIPL